MKLVLFYVKKIICRIVLESDASVVAARVGSRQEDIPLGEQTVAQVLQTAKEQLKWSLLK